MRSLIDYVKAHQRLYGRREMVPGLANWRCSLQPARRTVPGNRWSGRGARPERP